MRTPAPKSIHCESISKGRYILRLIENKTYLTPKHKVTWCDLIDAKSGSFEVGTIEAIHGWDCVVIRFDGAEWLKMSKSEWVRLLDRVMDQNEKVYGRQPLAEIIADREEHERVKEERARQRG